MIRALAARARGARRALRAPRSVSRRRAAARRRIGRRRRDQRAGGAAGERRGDEVMAVDSSARAARRTDRPAPTVRLSIETPLATRTRRSPCRRWRPRRSRRRSRARHGRPRQRGDDARATSASSNGSTLVADDLAGLVALAGDHQRRRPRREAAMAARDRLARGRRSRARRAPRPGSRRGSPPDPRCADCRR